MIDAVGLGGFIALVIGCYSYDPPLAMVVGGAIALTAAVYGTIKK